MIGSYQVSRQRNDYCAYFIGHETKTQVMKNLAEVLQQQWEDTKDMIMT